MSQWRFSTHRMLEEYYTRLYKLPDRTLVRAAS